jgi:hypothetical protein
MHAPPPTRAPIADPDQVGRLSDEALSRMTDDEVEATLTEVSGATRSRPNTTVNRDRLGRWSAQSPASGDDGSPGSERSCGDHG